MIGLGSNKNVEECHKASWDSQWESCREQCLSGINATSSTLDEIEANLSWKKNKEIFWLSFHPLLARISYRVDHLAFWPYPEFFWEKTLSYTFYLSPQVIRRQETFISAASVDWKHWEWATSSLPFKAPFWHHRVRELSACSSLIPFSLQVQRSSCNSGFFIRTIAITFDYILKFTFLYLLYLCCIICCKSNILCENDRLNFETNPKAKTYFESNAKRWRQPTLRLVKKRCLTFQSRTDWVQSSGAESFKSYQNL